MSDQPPRRSFVSSAFTAPACGGCHRTGLRCYLRPGADLVPLCGPCLSDVVRRAKETLAAEGKNTSAPFFVVPCLELCDATRPETLGNQALETMRAWRSFPEDR